MENMEEILSEEGLTEDNLQELKSWLFKENIRLMTATAELDEQREKFEQEKEQFKEEMKNLNKKMSAEQSRIRKDNQLVDERLEIIKDGFQKLDMDRRRLDKEWARLAAEKEFLEERGLYDTYSETSVFFRGVKNPLTLKKRYKDLTKIFHPDNLAGDTEMVQKINREYERLKREYEKCRQA
ncbi:MAG: J domain-containing protein [Lachnospiraceae bacterium]|nr:J domain-containing protein [Lachnospiraceae bacterium]